MEHIGIEPRGVDHRPGLITASIGGFHKIVVLLLRNPGNFPVELELHPVLGGILPQGVGQPEGADDGPGGGPEGGHGLVPDIGLFLKQGFPVQNFQALHPVLQAVFIQGLELWQVLPAQAQDQGAVAPIGKAQFLGKRLHHPASHDIVFCHQGTGLGIEPGVDNGAVGLGGAAAKVIAPLQQEEGPLESGKEPGGGTAHHTAADNHSIQHFSFACLSFLYIIPKKNRKSNSKGLSKLGRRLHFVH